MIAFIDDLRDKHGVEPICEVLPIAPATFHEHLAKRADSSSRSGRARRDAQLRPQIQRVFNANWQVYGVRIVWRQLRRGQRNLSLLGRGPDEPPPLQPLQEHASSFSIPPDDLVQIALPRAEHKHMAAELVLLRRLLRLRCQRGNAPTHVRYPSAARPSCSSEPGSSRKPARKLDLELIAGDKKASGIGSGITHNIDRQETRRLRRTLRRN
jgi:hypothetical protein